MNTTINIDKFVCSLMRFTPVTAETKYLIQSALKDQGLQYKDGEIQRIPFKEKQKAHIDEGLKNGSMARESDLLHPDDWYECIHSFLDEYDYPSFVKGEFANLGKILEMGVKEEQLKDYFKPCTECTKLSFPVDSQVFVRPLQIIGTVVKTYKEGCIVKELGLQKFHHYNDLEPVPKLKNTDTIRFDEEPKEKKLYFQNILTNEEDELRNKVKELLHKNEDLGPDSGFWSKEEVEQLKKDTDEGSKRINELMRKVVFAKEPDINAMVERFKEGIILSKNLKHDDLMVRAIAYRKGLEDMYKKLKGELV